MESVKEPDKHVVVIVTDGEFYSAAPRDLLCLAGDLIYFQNLINGEVVLTFESAKLFNAPDLVLRATETICQKVPQSVVGCYPYTVSPPGKPEQLQKTLKPRIIVYRAIP